MRVCSQCGRVYEDGVGVCPEDGQPTRAHGDAGATQVDPLLGRMVGSYRIQRLLGQGGMGAVYVGEHPAIGSKVAVKFLHPHYAQQKAVVTRFFNEAKAVNLIKHDNVVQVLDYMYLDGVMPCFVMEYLERGYPLTALTGKPVPLAVAGPIVLQICDALQAAHDKGIVHRDLKPDNVWLGVRNHRRHFVKIMDFGIAKLAGGPGEMGTTQTGQVLGTPYYMSPEQSAGNVGSIGAASDVYSLGVILFQLATGKVPFDGGFGEIIAAHIGKAPPAPRALEPSIPEPWERVILKAMAKKPAERFASMRELAVAVQQVMATLKLPLELPLDEGVDPLEAAQSGHGVESFVPGGRSPTASMPGSEVGATFPSSTPGVPRRTTGEQQQKVIALTPDLAIGQAPARWRRRAVLMAVAFALGFGATLGVVRTGIVDVKGLRARPAP